MSRIGREPIAVPAGVTITIADGNVVTVKGPLGELCQTFSTNITITQEGNTLLVTRPNDEKQNGKIVLGLGYSHPVVFNEENGVTFACPDSTTILVKGIDKQAVGQMAAVIRSKRPPEPYLGKGIKYTGEKIRRKAGKTGK